MVLGRQREHKHFPLAVNPRALGMLENAGRGIFYKCKVEGDIGTGGAEES